MPSLAPPTLALVTPFDPEGSTGNAVTARRWASVLEGLGLLVDVSTTLAETASPDALVALHAWRSAEAVTSFRRRFPERPVVVAITGTDVYDSDGPRAEIARATLEAATRIVALQPKAERAVPDAHRRRVRVIPQSADVAGIVADRGPLAGRAPASAFLACVLGHLREVKDPLRAALAARLAPQSSKLHVVQLGGEREDGWAERARAEDASNPRYTYVGPLLRRDALAVLAASDVHVLTSRSEGGPSALSEAARLGVPTITSAIDGTLGLLGDDYPGAFDVGDEHELARLLSRAENESAFLADLRARALALAPDLAPEAEVQRWRELLAELNLLPNSE